MENVTSVASAVIPLALLISGLFYSSLTDPYLTRSHKKIMIAELALVSSLIARSVLNYLLTVGERDHELYFRRNERIDRENLKEICDAKSKHPKFL